MNLALSDLGNAKRFAASQPLDVSLLKFRPASKIVLLPNTRPANWRGLKWSWFARSNKNGFSYFDPSSGEIRFRLRRRVSVIDHVFLHIGEQSNNAGKMVGAKADLGGVAGCTVGAVQDHIIDAFDIPTGQFDLAVGPYFVLGHALSLSDGLVLFPSEAKAGGASSPARQVSHNDKPLS